MNQFSNLSCTLTKIIDKKEKRENGIYFTPPDTIVRSLELVAKHKSGNTAFHNILEPSCGSCEFIEKTRVYYPHASITGIEYNKTIYESIKDKYANDGDGGIIRIIEGDFLKTAIRERFDLIIGNPPYYVLPKADVAKQYHIYFDGRPNIFLLFIIKSMTLLTDDGMLCFILPKSFLNCLYYNKTREYIYEYYKIISIEECDDTYIDTEQQTIIFIIQKKEGCDGDNRKYRLDKVSDHYTIFGTCEVIKRLNELYINATTLNALQFKVSVGNIVWNENKALLTDDQQKTRLIYSSDIKNNTLGIKQYANTRKKNYINKKGLNEPLLVINRGYGVGNYNLEYSLINCGFLDSDEYIREYLIENHLICIRYECDGEAEDIDLIDKYIQIYRSLGDDRTNEFIALYFGNNAINTTELSHILPIYI
jgi:adenine-specific DNA-methyltransferase